MPDDEELREELAAALGPLQATALFLWLDESRRNGVDDATSAARMGGYVADVLLPVVERYAARRAAETLRAAAGHATRTTPGTAPVVVPVSDLYDRAVVLDGQAGGK
jgi:hypothetical protein